MKEICKLAILILLVVYIISSSSYSEAWYNGEFINSVNNSSFQGLDFDYQDLSSEADFWHYSGGYWQTNYYGNKLRVYDYEILDYLKSDDSKLKINPATIKINLPEKLKLYLENGGSKENIKFSLESDYLFSKFKPDEIFEDQKIKYRILDNEIQIIYTPLFNIITKNNIQPTNGLLNISIPRINPKFGFPLFSIWNKDGTSLGNTNIGNIADLPEGHAFLDGRDPIISIDTSKDIINPKGDLVSKNIGIWNTRPRKYTITEKNTDDYRIGMGTFANGGAAGMKFILPLRMYYPVLEEDIPVTESKEVGIIRSMSPNNENYDVLLGIPSSDNVYTRALGKERITNHEFEKISGDKDFQVTVRRVYTEKWKVKDNKRSTDDKTVYKTKRRTKTVSQSYSINREYSYNRINYFENFGINSAKIYSDVLNNKEIVMYPENYETPDIRLENEENIVSEPSVKSVVTLSPKTVGKNGTPSNPDWKSIAEGSVGEYMVRNDSLIFDSLVIMDSVISEKSTPTPKDLPIVKMIAENVLMAEDLKIPKSVRNKVYENTGEIIYQREFNFNGISHEEIIKPISVNTVKVHTPIYSELLLSDIGDDYNQQKITEIDDRALILGMPTKFRYQTTGSHRNILGYGTRDYDNYISNKEIKFPFDIYYDATSREPSKFIEKNTWIEVNTLDTDIYVPIWVDEGSYTIKIRSKAINGLDTDIVSTSMKNIDDDYYIVEDEKIVEVIGRLYGFKVRDINDYPIWEEVFRTKPNSYEFIEGNNYPFGGKDENGNILRTNSKYFLPIAPGSHPTYTNAGSIPLGYKIRFTVETIGNYLKADQIVLKPSFSFVDYLGNEDKDIKVWSKVRINKKDHLIDLSAINMSIKDELSHTINLGDPYITLKEESLQNISDYLGISLFELKKKIETIGFADGIYLTKYLRSYIGNVSNKPDTVSESRIQQSRQKWYGEYWLPNDTYVLKDDIDLIAYATENNGVDFNENIFMKEGYLKVNFNIETLKDPESFGEDLIYKNTQSNMYQIEGFNAEKDVMINGIRKTFNFEDGDTIFYDVNRKRSDDYDNFGTH